MEEQIKKLQAELDDLKRKYADHRHTQLDTPKVTLDISEITGLPVATVTKPSGGVTVDSQARSAIDSIIDKLVSAKIFE